MAAPQTKAQRDQIWGAFLASKGMSNSSPVANPADFYDDWEDFLFRSQAASVTPNDSSGPPGSRNNPRVLRGPRGSEY